jgi:O-antigen/teichoic acid export membrane protein
MLFDATRRGVAAAVRRPRAAAFRRLGGQPARRLSWGVADQAVSSLTNFAVVILVARSLGAVQFGAFSLAYVTYGFALNASRGLATEPLMIRFSGVDVPAWRRAVANSTGTAAVVGLAAGACALAAAALLSGTTRAAFLALGLTLPGLLVQDSWRYAFFTLGRGSQAFLNDLVWAGALLPALVLLRVTGRRDVFWFVFAWGAAAAVAAAVGPLQARVMPKLSGTREWLSRHRDLGPRYLAEGTASSAASQLRTYSIGILLGLAAVGYVQAANTLMGPITILFLGMGLVTTPEAARVLHRSPRRLPLFCLLVSGGLAVAALMWGVVLLVALPRGLGEWLLGSIWRPTYPLVLPQTLVVIAQGVSSGAATGLGAMGAARRSLRVTLIGSGVYLACTLVGAVEGGAAGTVRGAAVAAWIAVLLWWWQLRAGLRESGIVPAGDRFWSGRLAGRHRKPLLANSRRRGHASDRHQPSPALWPDESEGE